MLAGAFAVQTISLQVTHLDDDDTLRLSLKNQLIEVAQFLADSEGSKQRHSGEQSVENDDSEDLCSLLIEGALNLAIAAPRSQDVFLEFSELLAHLAQIWTSLLPASRFLVQALSEELPIHDAQHFWPLLVRLRAQ